MPIKFYSVIFFLLLVFLFLFSYVEIANPLPNTTIKTEGLIGVYQDEECTVPLTSINWGTIYMWQTKTVKAYIKNLADYPMNLTLYIVRWKPQQITSVLRAGWLLTNTTLSAFEVRETNFFLECYDVLRNVRSVEFSFVYVVVSHKF